MLLHMTDFSEPVIAFGKCDLYDYLSGQEEYAHLFKGSYLTNYSWAETTLSELTGEYLYPKNV